MAADTVHIDITGGREVSQMLREVGLELQDLRPAMQDVGKYLKRYFGNDTFVSRGSVIGHPWPRLSTKYAARKARIYSGRPILVATGAMQRSFSYKSRPLEVEITNTAKHFVYHQSDAPRTIMPYRPMMAVKHGDPAYLEIVKIVNARIARTIKEKEVA